MNKKRLCNKCNSKVEIEKELDYPYYCPNCDENMYEFETHLQEKKEKQLKSDVYDFFDYGFFSRIFK